MCLYCVYDVMISYALCTYYTPVATYFDICYFDAFVCWLFLHAYVFFAGTELHFILMYSCFTFVKTNVRFILYTIMMNGG